MEYYTRYNRYPGQVETFKEPSLVGDDVQELSTKELISKFLDGQPQGMMTDPSDYDFPPNMSEEELYERTEGYWDKTRERGYDLFQAQRDLKEVEARLKNQKLAAEERAKLEAEKAALDKQVTPNVAATPDKADIAPPNPNDPAGGLNG